MNKIFNLLPVLGDGKGEGCSRSGFHPSPHFQMEGAGSREWMASTRRDLPRRDGCDCPCQRGLQIQWHPAAHRGQHRSTNFDGRIPHGLGPWQERLSLTNGNEPLRTRQVIGGIRPQAILSGCFRDSSKPTGGPWRSPAPHFCNMFQ